MIDLDKLIKLAEEATTCSACNGPAIYFDTVKGANCRLTTINNETIKKLCEVIRVYEYALRFARNQLGVPQPGYPAPVAYAADCIGDAIAKGKSILEGE